MTTVERTLKLGVDDGGARAGGARFKGTLRDIKKGANEAEAATNKLSASFKKLAVGLGALVGITTLGVAFSRAAKTFMAFETTLQQIVGLVGIAQKEVNAFGVAVRKMAVDTGKGPNELAQALFFITSAGLKGQRALDALSKSARASVAGLGETKQIADAVTSVMNAYSSANMTAAQATDIMVATVREGKLEASELSGSLGRVLAVAESAGVRFDEVGASIAALTRIGLSAAESVTGLRGVLVAVNRENEKGEKILNSVGLSYGKIRQAIREKGLLAALQQVSTAVKGNSTSLQKIFSDVEAVNTVLALTGGNAEQVRQIFERMANTTGALDTAYAAVADTAENRLNRAMQKLALIGFQIAAAVVPVLVSALELVINNANILIGILTALAARVLLCMIVPAVAAAIAGFGALASGLGVAGAASLIASAAFTTLGAAIRAVGIAIAANPIGAIAVALGLAVAAAIWLSDKIKDTSQVLMGLQFTADSVGQSIQATMAGIAIAIVGVAQKVAQMVVGNLNALLSGIAKVAAELQKLAAGSAVILRAMGKPVQANAAASFANILGGIKDGAKIGMPDFSGTIDGFKMLARVSKLNAAVAGEQARIAFAKGWKSGNPETKLDTGDIAAQMQKLRKKLTGDTKDTPGGSKKGGGKNILDQLARKNADIREQIALLTNWTGSYRQLEERLKEVSVRQEIHNKLVQAGIKPGTAAYQNAMRLALETNKLKTALDLKLGSMRRIQSAIDQINGNTVQYKADLAELNRLYKAGQINASTYAAVLDQLNQKLLANRTDFTSGLQRGLQSVGQDVNTWAKVAESGVQTVFDGLNQAWSDFLETGRFNWKKFLSGILGDIGKLLAKKAFQMLFKVGGDLLGGLFGGSSTGGGGGIGGGFAAAQGAVINAGRLQPFARGGLVDSPTLFPMRNGTGLMGEAGPEAIMPLSRMPDGSLGVQAKGGKSQARAGDNVTINQNFALGVQSTVRAEIRNMMAEIEASVRTSMVRAKREMRTDLDSAF